MSRRPVGSSLRSRMDLPDDNAAIVNHIPPSMHTDVLSLLRRIEQDDDDHYIEEDNLTWCAAGLESLRSVTWDRVREATSSDVNMHTLEEMATDGIPDSKNEMPETIRTVPREHHIDRRSDPIQGHGYRTALTPRLDTEHSTRCPPGHIDDDRSCRILCVLARHIGRHQYHSKKTANTATGWHPHNLEHRPPHRSRWSTPSRQCARTSLYTGAYTTS